MWGKKIKIINNTNTAYKNFKNYIKNTEWSYAVDFFATLNSSFQLKNY